MSMLEQQAKSVQQTSNITLYSPASRQAARSRQLQTILVYGGRIVFVVLLLVVWQFGSGRFLDPLVFSSPLDIAKQLGTWIIDGTLWFNTEVTLEEIFLGLFFGVISGLLVGFMLGIQPLIEKIFNPFIIALNSIPKIALAPLFILWFGVDLSVKVVLAAVTVFFLVFLNTLAGVRNVDQNLIDAVRLMGGKRQDIIFKVIVPSATGHVLTGLHTAIPYALIGAVIAELMTSNRGIGSLINASGTEYNTAGVFAALLVLTIVAAILNAIVNLIDRKTSHWKAGLKMRGENG